jgi:hypothetical protein
MKRRLVLGAVSVLAVVIAACSSGPHVSSGTEPTSTTSTTTTVASVTTTTVPTSTPPVTPTTVFGSTDIKGITLLSQISEGNTTTRHFTVAAGTKQWDVAWSYDCPGAAPKGSLYYNFALDVYRGSALDTKDAAVATPDATGQGTQSYTDTGTFSLHLGAQEGCTWAYHVIVPSG